MKMCMSLQTALLLGDETFHCDHYDYMSIYLSFTKLE
jgi:hypothetical protein